MLNYQRVSWKLFRWLSKIEKFHHVSWFVHLHKVVLRCDFHSKNFPRFVCWVCCITQIFSGGDFLRNLNSSGPSREVSLTAAKISKAFFSLYTLYTIVLILYRYNTHGFSYGPIGKKDSINHSSPVFLVCWFHPQRKRPQQNRKTMNLYWSFSDLQ